MQIQMNSSDPSRNASDYLRFKKARVLYNEHPTSATEVLNTAAGVRYGTDTRGKVAGDYEWLMMRRSMDNTVNVQYESQGYAMRKKAWNNIALGGKSAARFCKDLDVDTYANAGRTLVAAIESRWPKNAYATHKALYKNPTTGQSEMVSLPFHQTAVMSGSTDIPTAQVSDALQRKSTPAYWKKRAETNPLKRRMTWGQYKSCECWMRRKINLELARTTAEKQDAAASKLDFKYFNGNVRKGTPII